MSFLCFDKEEGHFKILEHDGRVTKHFNYVEFTAGLHFNNLRNTTNFKIPLNFAEEWASSFYICYDKRTTETTRYKQEDIERTFEPQVDLVYT